MSAKSPINASAIAVKTKRIVMSIIENFLSTHGFTGSLSLITTCDLKFENGRVREAVIVVSVEVKVELVSAIQRKRFKFKICIHVYQGREYSYVSIFSLLRSDASLLILIEVELEEEAAIETCC